jgi:predicted alpha/beta superfamily hydrolase
LRCRDLTPTHDPSEWWRVAGAAEPIVRDFDTGHARDFMKALEQDVKTLVTSHYRTRPSEAVLAGFSLGGLFTLHVLFSRPESFRGYICGSPSLWWHDGVMFERERQYATREHGLATDLFLCVGALESAGAAQSARMVENVRAFAHQLATRNYPGLRCQYKVFEDDTHATSAGPAFAHGLRAMFTRNRAQS